jgi:preprotein translocase subunit SecG
MYQLILVIHIFACVCLIALVLVQQGKGATMGAAFGSGASQTVFGSRGSGSFLLRVTTGFVIVFFTTSLSLNFIAGQASRQGRHIVLPTLPASSNIPAPASAVTPESRSKPTSTLTDRALQPATSNK